MRKIIKKIKMKKENIMVVLSGAVFMTVMDVSNVLAAGDASSVTKPLDNLKTLVFAIIGAIGVIILTLDVNTKDIINQNWKSKPKIWIMWYNKRESFIFDLLERNSKFGLRRI